MENFRFNFQYCHYCHQRGATIGCCVKSCRRSFHLPCALKEDCRFEFSNTFRSFCDEHHNLKRPKNAHKPTDLCTICYDEMGKFNLIQSIALPCCTTDAWCHKLCLQKYAQTSGYFLTCPLCKDSDKFRDWITSRGVFIPDRDAKWELDETDPGGSFYGYAQVGYFLIIQCFCFCSCRVIKLIIFPFDCLFSTTQDRQTVQQKCANAKKVGIIRLILKIIGIRSNIVIIVVPWPLMFAALRARNFLVMNVRLWLFAPKH